MSVEQMILLSRIFAGLMLSFLVMALIMFFVLEIQKAWHIVVGTRIALPNRKNGRAEELRSGKLSETGKRLEKREQPKKREETKKLDDGYGATTALTEEGYAETAVLQEGQESLRIATDITFVQTSVSIWENTEREREKE